MTTTTRTLSACALAIAIASAGCSSQGQNTQVLVDVDAEPGVRAMANTLIVRVYRGRLGEMVPSTVVFERPFDVSAGTGRWPRRVALAPMVRGDDQSIYRFEASAYREGSPTAESIPVATVRLISGYSRDQTLSVRLVLQDACVGVVCGLDETCDRGGCIDATIPVEELARDGGLPGMDGGVDAGGDGGPICDPAACDDGLSCTSDFCNTDGTCGHSTDDSMCDDGAECTMDRCVGAGGDANGCTHVARTGEPCADDGDFCTGVETCNAAGECAGSGDPCMAPTTCIAGECMGCTTSGDCPSPITTPGACSYLETCSEAGTAMDVVTTFACVAGTCTGTDAIVPRTCARDTDGLMCGDTTYTAWTCGGFATTCDESGTETRNRVTRACAGGTCMATGVPETRPCSRDTDGAGCEDGDGCTRPDSCAAGTCSAGPNTCGDAGGPVCSSPGDCDDFRECTIDQCVSGGTFCQHRPDDSLCPTQINPCIVVRCAPADPTSDPSTGCVTDYSACGDGGVGDECVDARDCDDANDCTFDECIFPFGSPSFCDHYNMCFDDGGTIMIDGGGPPPPPDAGI